MTLAVGQENPRESRRFRWPIYITEADSWPWCMLAESKALADDITKRYNRWDELNAKLTEAYRRLAAYTTAPDNQDGPA